MNHIHRSVWSSTLGTCVATSEHVRGRTQSASGGKGRNLLLSFALQQLPLALALLWGVSIHAAPMGGEITAGKASIDGTTKAMVIKQSTDFVSIDWKSFGIATGESVQFVQPSQASVALNRVLGGNASEIMGKLSANGQVFLINPNGILFGKGASVSVGGLVASTLGLSNDDAQAGRYGFGEGGTGTIINHGQISAASGGYVALMGHSVSNTGMIVAPLGTVALAAGDAVRLDISGDQLINVAVERGVADAWLNNGGWLQADGGWVTMSTQVAGDVLSNAVNNTGVVQAHTVEERNGNIVLLAGMDMGTLTIGGTLDVGSSKGRGGRVVATAHGVSLVAAQIIASGDTGGGAVLVGGGYEGKNAAIPNAEIVVMDEKTQIQADARYKGHGGLVVLWSDGVTHAHGDITARGGSKSGDGGLVETSGQRLDVGGVKVDTRAPMGRVGDWLLDPADITISSAITADITESSGSFEPDSGVGFANINVDDLTDALLLSNVTITTANTGVSGGEVGDIDVDAPITWTAPTTLTLNADRDVNVNFAITGTNGSFVANAGRDVNVLAAITTTTGRLAFTAGQDIKLNAATTVTTGELSALAGRHVNVTAASTVTSGNMVLRADKNGTGPGADQGTVTISCGVSCITLTTGELNIRFNPVNYGTTDTEILTFANALTGGGSLNAKAWVFGEGDDRPYDSTTTATVNGLALDTADQAAPVEWTGATSADFDDPNAGVNKIITYTSTFTDPDYELFAAEGQPANTYQTQADIIPKALTITATDVNKAFGESPALTDFTTTPLAGDETVGSVTLISDGQGAAASANGSPYAITASDATGGTFTASNYDITYVNGVLTIDADPVDPPIDPPVDPVDPPVEPLVDSTRDPSSAISGEQALPVVQPQDPLPVQLVALESVPNTQGLLSFPLASLPLPAPAPVLAKPLANEPKKLQEEDSPPARRAAPVKRVPKQDRN